MMRCRRQIRGLVIASLLWLAGPVSTIHAGIIPRLYDAIFGTGPRYAAPAVVAPGAAYYEPGAAYYYAPSTAYYYAPTPATSYYYTPSTAYYYTPQVAAAAPATAACTPCQTCQTSYVLRSYYTPVTQMVTRASVEPQTQYVQHNYYDACSCSYTSYYQPVTQMVTRYYQVPVTTYSQHNYYQPVTSCTTAAPAPAVACNTCAPAPSVIPAPAPAPAPQSSGPPAPIPANPNYQQVPTPSNPPDGSGIPSAPGGGTGSPSVARWQRAKSNGARAQVAPLARTAAPQSQATVVLLPVR